MQSLPRLQVVSTLEQVSHYQQMEGCGNTTTIKWDDNSTASTRIVTPNATTTYSFRCVNGTCESTTVSKTVNSCLPIY